MARVTSRQLPTRQRIRKSLLYLSLLLFPITLYYFSPALIIMGASEGIVNGSLLVFGSLFVSALFFGRAWCGWLCPAGGLQELAAPINDRALHRGRLDWIKWIVIWIPWMALIVGMFVQAGGIRAVQPLYNLDGGVTLLQPFWYMIYYIVIATFLLLAVIIGRRAGCHYVCWMAPFMILGRRVANLARWPALRLQANAQTCRTCGACTRGCPMSLNVQGLVQRGDMEDAECILCGTCVDGCPTKSIAYTFRGGRPLSRPLEAVARK